MARWQPDLDSLRLFVAVCEEGNIARAAARQSITASAISKRVSEMEHALATPLLVRSGRGVEPTAAGTTMLRHARLILRQTDLLRVDLEEHTDGVRGHVVVLANASSLAQFLPIDIASFIADFPGVRVDFEERVSPDILHGIRDGVADIGVCIPAADATDADDVELRPYSTDELMLIVPQGHPLALRSCVSFVETLDNPFVGLQRSSRMTTYLSALAAERGLVMDHRMYVGTFDAACNIIAEGLAVAILAHGAVRIYEQALGLRSVPLSEPWARRQVMLCMRDRETMTQAARNLADHLEACGQWRNTDAKRRSARNEPFLT